MKPISFLIAIITASLFQFAQAAESTPFGQWETIDDVTGKAKSIVNIWQEGDELKGQIITILDPAKKDKLCTKCSGSKKNKPVEGMVFIWGLEKDGDRWTGGRILDPDNGKEYKANITVINDGQNLEVRGYIGFALIGRSQIWNRVQ